MHSQSVRFRKVKKSPCYLKKSTLKQTSQASYTQQLKLTNLSFDKIHSHLTRDNEKQFEIQASRLYNPFVTQRKTKM